MPESNKCPQPQTQTSSPISSSSTSATSSTSSSSNGLSNNKTNESYNNTLVPNSATEKPTHYTYLKEFRVDQCSLFLQHKCTQHRPYTCFYWHFKNQRRRRPTRKRDGTFNYNPDIYCDKFDEQTGLCPSGDECPHVHRNAGDTEKRYHLRYYKTAACIHETDTKGNCVKNGTHCAFAHGTNDLRTPVYDLRELQPQQPNEFVLERLQVLNSNLEKDKLLNEDDKWNETNYVLIYYKTEQCKRPPRLCRQGFACPSYHNARDKRRNPQLFKYRSTPCPQVKQGDDWLEPSVCDSGDSCKYCHSRTEQQFHPEIYKSSKCNDMITSGYCPRGPFCAFAHIESELNQVQRTHSTSESSDHTLENYIGSVVPGSSNDNDQSTNTDNESVHEQQQVSSTLAGTSLTITRPIGAEREDILRALQSPQQQTHQISSPPPPPLPPLSSSSSSQQASLSRPRMSITNANAALIAAAASIAANKYQTDNLMDSAINLDESMNTSHQVTSTQRSFISTATSLPIQIPIAQSCQNQSGSPLNAYFQQQQQQNETRRQSMFNNYLLDNNQQEQVIAALRADLLKEKQNSFKLEANFSQCKQFYEKHKQDLNDWQQKCFQLEQDRLLETQKCNELKKRLDYLESSLNNFQQKPSLIPVNDNELSKLPLDKLQSLQLVLKNDSNKIEKILLEKSSTNSQ